MNSPPKRRRSGSAPGDAAGASQSGIPRQTLRSSVQSSFQSPTKSSLAKSHPKILDRALSRSPSRRSLGIEGNEGYGSDENAVGLRGRKALRPSLGGTSSPLKPPRMPDNAPVLSPSRRASGIQSFTKPPRRLSKKIVPGDFWFGSPTRKQPLSMEQDLSHTPESQLALELGSATREATLPQQHMDTGLDGGFMYNDLEPDLPPTPTQLGLEKAPDRPTALPSSSPSARREKKTKRKAFDLLQGSPLKTMRFRPQSPDASDTSPSASQDDLSAAALEKRKLRRSLAKKLRNLADEVEELTKWTGKVESGFSPDERSEDLNHLLSLLSEESSHTKRNVLKQAPSPVSSLLCTLLPFSKNITLPSQPTSPLPRNPFALKESSQMSSFLTAFAPLVLQARTTRSAIAKSNVILEIHTLTFTPPPPFPASLYNISVVYHADPITQSVVSVSVPTGSESKKRRIPEVLRQWVEARLANPLLNLDVATLCWGINRYWEASIARARLWAYIDRRYGSSGNKSSLPKSQPGVIRLSELRRLIPHLERSTMVVQPEGGKGLPRVLLSNALTIDDWTGEPQLRPELSVSISGFGAGAGKKVDQGTKMLFHALLDEGGTTSISGLAGCIHFDAIIRATEGAIGALFGRD